MQTAAKDKFRIEVIDLARGVALAAMAIFHFTWDLEFFGYVPPGLTREAGWMLFARSIASSFLFLVGVSLYLGHGRGLRWPSFLRRLVMVGGAALVITVATWFAMPSGFIFFGILHQIALASLLGLVFLKLPAFVTVAVAVFVISAPHFLRHAFFDHPMWWWVGLSTVNPHANDYVPLFPWFAAVLLGIAAAKIAQVMGLVERLGDYRPGGWSGPLQYAGRHSLFVYLVHQPVLIGAIWLFAQVVPPPPPQQADFIDACQAECTAIHGEVFCSGYCLCMLERIEEEGLSEAIWDAAPGADLRDWLETTALTCSMLADSPQSQEAEP